MGTHTAQPSHRHSWWEGTASGQGSQRSRQGPLCLLCVPQPPAIPKGTGWTLGNSGPLLSSSYWSRWGGGGDRISGSGHDSAMLPWSRHAYLLGQSLHTGGEAGVCGGQVRHLGMKWALACRALGGPRLYGRAHPYRDKYGVGPDLSDSCLKGKRTSPPLENCMLCPKLKCTSSKASPQGKYALLGFHGSLVGVTLSI